MKSYTQFKSKTLKDKKINKAYGVIGLEFAIIQMIIEKRIVKGLTQGQLARKIGTKQSAISRLESGTYNPSISFLKKVADALDTRLKISIS